MNRRKWILLSTISCSVIIVTFVSYIGWKYYNRATLQIEAKLIYNLGGPQPIARQKFYLLNKNIVKVNPNGTIAGEKIIDNSINLTSSLKWVMLIASFSDYERSKVLDEEQWKLFLGVLEDIRPVFLPYLVGTEVTDFSGSASFKNIKPGNYYLVGLTETRSGIAFWHLETKVKRGENIVILSQENALIGGH